MREGLHSHPAGRRFARLVVDRSIRMNRLFIIITFLVLPAFSGVHTGSVQMSFFKIEEDNNDLVVTWQTAQENEVREFELQRMTRFTNNQFVKVQSVPPHGPNKRYVFRDDQVFKVSSEQVDYRLEVIYMDGVREELAREQVNYTSTAIRRTWGSIKAMFQ